MLFTPRSFGKKQKKLLISEINYPPTKDRWVLKIIIMEKKHLVFLTIHEACPTFLSWAGTQPDLETLWASCHRGDWLLWLAEALEVDHRKIIMTNALCAHTVIHLMKDKRSRDAVRAAFLYGRGKITRDELTKHAWLASAALDDAFDDINGYSVGHSDADTAVAAASTAYFTADDAPVGAVPAYTDAAIAIAIAADTHTDKDDDAADWAMGIAGATALDDDVYGAFAFDAADNLYAAKRKNPQQTADICRKMLTHEVEQYF